LEQFVLFDRFHIQIIQSAARLVRPNRNANYNLASGL
jgi:hypothetical protein